jgi:monoamine oxidase
VATTAASSRIIATAGQVGVDQEGVFPQNPDDQIALAIANLRRCLEAAGATPQDVFKLVLYTVGDKASTHTLNRHLAAFLNGHRPATTLVSVSKLVAAECIFEVEAYASVSQYSATSAVDVIVIGAGLSGLKAAYDVQKSGLSCLVLEARDRVGGKTWSIDPLGTGSAVDVGAAWINDTTQSKIYELVRSLGLGTVVQNTKGNVVQEDLGGCLQQFPYGSVPNVGFLSTYPTHWREIS